MMICYLRDVNKFLRYRTLCMNILRCKFPTKSIELTWLEFFEGPRVHRFDALGLDHFDRLGAKICRKQVKLWSKKFECGWLRWWNFAIKIALRSGRFLFLIVHWQARKVSIIFALRLAAKIFSYYIATLQPTEKNSRKWFLLRKSFCTRRLARKTFMWIMVPRLISHKLQLSSMEIWQHWSRWNKLLFLCKPAA